MFAQEGMADDSESSSDDSNFDSTLTNNSDRQCYFNCTAVTESEESRAKEVSLARYVWSEVSCIALLDFPGLHLEQATAMSGHLPDHADYSDPEYPHYSKHLQLSDEAEVHKFSSGKHHS